MITFLLITVFCLVSLYFFYSKKTKFPPGPRGLPLIGCTRFLRQLSQDLGGQHLAFAHLSKLYKSPIISVKLGTQTIVVVMTPSIVREVLTRDEFVGRPDNFFVRLRCFGAKRGITFADGSFWHQQRSFTLRTLRDLGMGKQSMESLIHEQIQELVEQFRGGSIRPIEVLSPCIIRVLWRIVAGEYLRADHPQLLKLIRILNARNRAFDMAGGMLSQMPWIRFIAPKLSGYTLLTSLNEELRSFLMETINKHKETYNPDTTRDFIDAYLHEIHKKTSDYTEQQMIMILVDLFLGGASSTTTTLDFAFLLMILHPDVQEKIHRELNGHDKITTAVRLPYTEAVLMEVHRFCSIIPIIGPRRALKDTILSGFVIPKDTTVLISEWSVHHDPEVFPEPGVFKPERFLDPLTREHLIPFGAGKRRCLGQSLAKPCLFMIFAEILRNFEISADGDGPAMAPVPGIILTPQPYTAVFTKREF